MAENPRAFWNCYFMGCVLSSAKIALEPFEPVCYFAGQALPRGRAAKQSAGRLTHRGERAGGLMTSRLGEKPCCSCSLHIYDYSDSEDKFRQKELPLAPPFAHVNRLALPES